MLFKSMLKYNILYWYIFEIKLNLIFFYVTNRKEKFFKNLLEKILNWILNLFIFI